MALVETLRVVLKEHSEEDGVNWMEKGLYQSDLGGRTNGLSKENTCRYESEA